MSLEFKNAEIEVNYGNTLDVLQEVAIRMNEIGLFISISESGCMYININNGSAQNYVTEFIGCAMVSDSDENRTPFFAPAYITLKKKE